MKRKESQRKKIQKHDEYFKNKKKLNFHNSNMKLETLGFSNLVRELKKNIIPNEAYEELLPHDESHKLLLEISKKLELVEGIFPSHL